MQDAENNPVVNDPSGTPTESEKLLRQPSKPNPVLFNEHGMRAGWRFLLFLVLVRVVVIPLVFMALHPFRHALGSYVGDFAEFLLMLGVWAATYMMARLERRSFFAYGLRDSVPLRHFLSGIATGFAALTLMLLVLHLFHYFDFGPQHMRGLALWRATLANLLAFAVVAVFEETAFRGYPLHTLTDGIGFWPSAVLMSLLFAYVHRQNPGEAPMGIAAVFAFGMMLAFSLWRTGSLLWAIGFHFMWDFSETFIYGVPDSGFVSPEHLLTAKFSGPAWITGGTVGPEGSIFIFLVLAAVAIVVHFQYSTRHFEFRPSESTKDTRVDEG